MRSRSGLQTGSFMDGKRRHDVRVRILVNVLERLGLRAMGGEIRDYFLFLSNEEILSFWPKIIHLKKLHKALRESIL
jgi:hypothetical protein